MHMKRITSSIMLLFLLMITNGLLAQNIIIKGRVVDAETNNPVEFANIGVVGTYMGTASDFDGYYELTVGESFINYKVQISAVGYQPKEFTVDELNVLNGESIKLFAQTYGIQVVDVKADSKRLYGILKTAGNIIADSYEPAYAANVYLSQDVNENKTEAVISFADAKGYGNRSLAMAFESRGFQVKEVRRNYESTPIKKGVLMADDVLAFDIVRQRGNVLDVDFVNDYHLELAEEKVVEDDSVWVINYKLDKPTMANTGDAYCIKYKGTIVLRQKDFSVVTSEIKFTSKGFYETGRDVYRDAEGAEEYTCKVVSNYRKTANDKYALSKIKYEGKNSTTDISIDWIVYDYQAYDKEIDKTFYTDKEQNADYWSRFSLPAE